VLNLEEVDEDVLEEEYPVDNVYSDVGGPDEDDEMEDVGEAVANLRWNGWGPSRPTIRNNLSNQSFFASETTAIQSSVRRPRTFQHTTHQKK
jgi:hypothetical protein